MARELAPFDIRKVPELARLVDEVRVSRKPRRLVRDDEDVALLVPARPATRRRKAITSADDAAFLASAGSWQDVDTDTLLTDIYEGRRSSRPPVDL
jgi:hypothetical protein